MRLFKIITFGICAVLLIGCATNQSNSQKQQNQKKQDPIIEQEARKNAKLMAQSEEEILASMQLPDITYKFDSIRPPEESYEILDKIANILSTHPKLKLIIEGNTDIVGDKDYNYWLGASRAAAMKSYLVSRGVQADSIRIHSYGSDKPITLDNSPEGRLTNRRIHFVLTKRDWPSIY